MSIKKTGIFLVLLGVLCVTSAAADIYMFVDKDGVVQFTNVPTSPEFRLYMKEKPAKKNLRVFSSTAYDDIIQKAHKKYGVDFSLIKAVIKVESDFNPKAVSKKGARGLMQIMPQNFESLSIKDPFNPHQNIMAGALHLKRLLRRYEYKLSLALAAYNAGTTAVDKYSEIPPYPETQNYVKKVLKTYSRYKSS